MAGNNIFKASFDFTAVDTIVCQHDVGGPVQITPVVDRVARIDLVDRIEIDPTDPANKCTVFLKSAQTGIIVVFEADIIPATQPSVQESAALSAATPPSVSNPYATQQDVDAHADLTNNPHGTTALQVGAAAVVHTHVATDVTDFQTAVSANTDVGDNTNHRGLTNNPHSTTAVQVGAIPTSEKGAVNGVATLDGSGKVPAGQIPVLGNTTYVVADSTERLAISSPVEGDLAIQTDDGSQWVWDGAAWQQLPTASGDVTGPASATNEAIARFDSTTGKAIQNSLATINDTGLLNTKLLKVEPVTPGTTNHVSFDVNQDTGDDYNLNLDTGDPGRVIATTQYGSFRNAFVFASDSSGANTVMGVSTSANGGSTWSPRFVVSHDGHTGINKNNPTEALDVVGDVVLTGTVDGRDVAADGTKLDTIQSGATVDSKDLQVSSNDTTPGFLEDKLVVGPGLTKTIQNDGANETILLDAPTSSASDRGVSTYNGGGFAIPDVWTNVPLTTAFNSTDFTVGSDDITVNIAGTYLIIAHMFADQVSGNSRDSSEMRVTRNGTQIPGMLGGLYHRQLSDGRTTACVAQYISLGSGDVIALQAQEDSGSGEMEVETASLVLVSTRGPKGDQGPAGTPGAGSSIVVQDEGVTQGTITTLDVTGVAADLTVAGSVATLDVSGSVFGQDYLRADASSELTTGGTGDSTVALTLSIPGGLNGTYRLSWGVRIGSDNTINNAEARLYDATAASQIGERYIYESQDSDNRISIGCTHNITLSGAAKDIQIRYRSADGAGTTIVGERFIEFWRVA